MVDHGFFDDQYCVRPKCACRDAIISFHPLPTRNEAGTKPLTKLPESSCISVCYHYDSGDVEILPDSRHEEATGRELIVALRQLQPDVGGFLAKRHGRAPPVASLFHEANNGAIARAQIGTKRSLSLWQRQEIQEVLRGVTKVGPGCPTRTLGGHLGDKERGKWGFRNTVN